MPQKNPLTKFLGTTKNLSMTNTAKTIRTEWHRTNAELSQDIATATGQRVAWLQRTSGLWASFRLADGATGCVYDSQRVRLDEADRPVWTPACGLRCEHVHHVN